MVFPWGTLPIGPVILTFIICQLEEVDGVGNRQTLLLDGIGVVETQLEHSDR